MKKYGIKISALVMTQLFFFTNVLPASSFQDSSHKHHLRTPSFKEGLTKAGDGSGKQFLQELGLFSKDGATRQLVELREDIAKGYPDLFGTKIVNGRKLHVEELIAAFTVNFAPDFMKVLSARWEFQKQVAERKARYSFLDPGKVIEDADGNKLTVVQIRQGMLDNFLGRKTKVAWRLNASVPIPEEVMRPGLQGTGPFDDLGMAMSAINSLIASHMADWEDAGNDFKDKFYQAWRNLMQLLAGEWEGKTYLHPTKQKEYSLKVLRKEWPTIFLRVPGLHLKNRQIALNGQQVPAIIPALILHTLLNYESLKKNGSGVYFYVPKIETPEEALLVAQLLKTLEGEIGVPRGTIKIEMLNERARYTANQEAIMWALRGNLIGPNVGRWDYINSRIEMLKDDPKGVFPDPHTVTMTEPTMTEYTRRNALLTLLVGGFPIGGMSAALKRPGAPQEVNDKAVRSIWFDKLRERLTGLFVFEGKLYDTYRQSWVATMEEEYVRAGEEPLKVDVDALQGLVDRLTDKEREQLEKLGLIKTEEGKVKITPFEISREELTVEKLYSQDAWDNLFRVPKGERTIEGLEYAIYMASEYMFQQLNGNNAAAIEDYLSGNRLMNDFATYEIFWHYLKTALDHEVELTQDGRTSDGEEFKKGTPVTKDLMIKLLRKRTAAVEEYFAKTPDTGRFDRSKAPVVMEILERQLLHPQWIMYGSRVLLSVIEVSDAEREKILDAIFSPREEVVQKVKAAEGEADLFLAQKALRAHDFVYDLFLETEGPTKSQPLLALGSALREKKAFRKKVAEIQIGWKKQQADGRFIKRLHTAEAVAALQIEPRPDPTVQNAVANKFYERLRKRQETGTSINTFGPFDEASIEAMARAGIEGIYLGGWAESARAGSSDQARYPYSHIAETVARFSRILQQHARHQGEKRSRMNVLQLAKESEVDFLVPLFVDIDTGHLAPKEIVEHLMTHGMDAPLVGAIHIEDQAHGCKKCGHMSGKVVVSTSEMEKRLNEVRLQLDVMGLDTLVVARTDAEAAEFIASNLDEHDHPFILGATNLVRPYHTVIQEARGKGLSEAGVEKIHKQWQKEAGLMTLGETVAKVIEKAEAKGESFNMTAQAWREFAKNTSYEAAKSKAEELGIHLYSASEWKLIQSIKPELLQEGQHLLWDWDLPKTEELEHTLWMVKSGTDTAIARSKAYLPLADISWMEQHHPNLEQTRMWAKALIDHAKTLGLPQPLLANNVSPSFYWRGEHEGKVMTDEELRTFLDEQAKAGIQFQFVTYLGSQLNHYGIQRFADKFKEEGMLAVADFQDEAIAAGNAFVSRSQRWAGVEWNEARDTAGRGGQSVISPTGGRDTMNQFTEKREEGEAGKDGAAKVVSAREMVSSKAIFKTYPWAKILLSTLPPFSLKKLPKTETLFVIDGSLLENKTTREEFRIVLSLFREAGWKNTIWLVDVDGKLMRETDYLEKLKEIYDLVELVPFSTYSSRLNIQEWAETPLVRIGYQDHEGKMELLDIALRRPKEGEIVSAFGFMTLALGKDPALAELMQQVETSLKNIEASLVFTPTAGYLEVVETVYRQL